MFKSVLFAASALAISAALAAGQEGPPSRDAASASEKTITGCVTKGSSPGEFFLADAKSHKTLLLSSDTVASHAGKQVKATGTMEKSGDTRVFRVTRVDVIADTCSAQ